MNHRGCLGLLFSLALLLIGATGWYVWNFARIEDPRVEFGYYGKMHQAARVIREIPGATIVDQWKHEDIVLEDFGFTLRLGDGPAKRVDFWDGTPVKEDGDDAAIREHVMQTYAAREATSR